MVQVLKREVVRQAHIIEDLRIKLQKYNDGSSDPDLFTINMLPPPMDPESQLSMGCNSINLKECAGDMD